MTISSALNNALTGLTANARLASVTSGNLANALTPGYGRQSVVLSPSVTAGQATGVRVDGVVRASDPELTAARRLADGDLARGTATFDALSRLEAVVGADAEPSGLRGRIDAFETALRQLAEAPEVPARQQSAASAATRLAVKFNQISTESVRVREAADGEIARRVDEVNAALRKIARLNRQIQLFTVSGRDSAALVDERARLVDTVAQNVPIRENRTTDDGVELYTTEGVKLVGFTSRSLSFTPTPVMEPGLSFAGGAGPLGGLRIGDLDVTPGGSGAQAIAGGALAGLFDVRDRIIPEAERQIDSLAADLVLRFQTATVDPTLSPGQPALFTDRGVAFSPADTVGIAARITVNPIADPAQGGNASAFRDGLYALQPRSDGDPTIPQALRDALLRRVDAAAPPATPGVAGNLTLAERATAVVERTAGSRVSAETEVSSLASARTTLSGEEASRLGVDTDVELQQLIRIEQAYAANAQVIQAASRMLEDLTRLGR